MRRFLIFLTLGAGLAVGTIALAEDDCDRPMQDWLPRAEVERKARDMGVEVRRIRTDDGCYKVYGRMADGRLVEIEMDPVTLEVIEIEYRNGDEYRGDRHRGDDEHGDDDDHDEDEDDDDGEGAGGALPLVPLVPANPLIGPATGSTN